VEILSVTVQISKKENGAFFCCELGIESARNEKYEFLRFLVLHD
jgi:hypothetical protein